MKRIGVFLFLVAFVVTSFSLSCVCAMEKKENKEKTFGEKLKVKVGILLKNSTYGPWISVKKNVDIITKAALEFLSKRDKNAALNILKKIEFKKKGLYDAAAIVVQAAIFIQIVVPLCFFIMQYYDLDEKIVEFEEILFQNLSEFWSAIVTNSSALWLKIAGKGGASISWWNRIMNSRNICVSANFERTDICSLDDAPGFSFNSMFERTDICLLSESDACINADGYIKTINNLYGMKIWSEHGRVYLLNGLKDCVSRIFNNIDVGEAGNYKTLLKNVGEIGDGLNCSEKLSKFKRLKSLVNDFFMSINNDPILSAMVLK